MLGDNNNQLPNLLKKDNLFLEGLSQEMLARSVGATRKSVQRSFQQWHKDDIVMRRGRYYVITSNTRLSEIAGEDAPRFDHITKE